MTKLERQIVTEAIKERQKAMLYYYEEGMKTGNWEDHEKACEALGAVRELGVSLGVIITPGSGCDITGYTPPEKED